MKQTTKQKAIEWLKTAKKGDKFSIDTVPHSKKQIEELLGIKVEKDADMGQTSGKGHSEELGVGVSESTE